MHVEPDQPADASGTDRPTVTAPSAGPRRPCRRREVWPRRHSQRTRARSARETAARVAIGALARQLLGQFGTHIVSHVISIGSASLPDPLAITYEDVRAIRPDAPLSLRRRRVELEMIAEIDRAREAGDTMGGSFEVIARGVPVGLGRTCSGIASSMDGWPRR